jgi:hypothetical protein
MLVAAVAMFSGPLVAGRVGQWHGYAGSVVMFGKSQAGFPRRSDLAYARHLLSTPAAAWALGTKPTGSAEPLKARDVALFHSHARTKLGVVGTVIVRTYAPTPERAYLSTLDAMLAIDYASSVDLVAQARKRLASAHYAHRRRQRAGLKAFIAHPVAGFAIRRLPTVSRLGPAAAERVGRNFPNLPRARPDPWIAAACGLALTAAFWLAVTARLPAALSRIRPTDVR